MKCGVAVILTFVLELCIFADADMRTWTFSDGKTVEAKFIILFGSKVTLENSNGVQKKVEWDLFSDEDQIFIELATPPRLDISFVRKTGQRIFKPYFVDMTFPDIEKNTFGVSIKQSGSYSHELHVEVFVTGKEISGNKYQLLERNTSSYIPSKENGYSHRFLGKEVELDDFTRTVRGFAYIKRSGVRYTGHLILVTDSRGVLITSKATSPWLLENLEKLKKLPVGSYMDKTCTRTRPSQYSAAHY